ncbi:hypothetical protein O181_087467 [Austropuccinia psidii MF-1]|uniref:SNF2 N-terminal domain-containing protein n=1 Tax=Austropuccinia psidii MF-1 TaxID=1389203 RepID=A0A9Q3IPQ4_9BASI|nr:hypothetical protein [Austropuccinia psidii MF-1]
MSTPSQPLCIGMINIRIQINRDITLNPDNSHLASWIILWHNQHNIFVDLPNHQNTVGSLPGTLSKKLIPFLGASQTFTHCGPGGAWIENCQSNTTQKLFVEGVFMTDTKDLCSSQKPNLALITLNFQSLNDSNYLFYPITLSPLYSYIFSQYTATHHAINSLLSSHQICLTSTPAHNTIYDLLGIISFITQPQSSDHDNWSPFILSSLSKGRNDLLQLELRHLRLRQTKTKHLESLPTISHHYELLPLKPTIQQEYSTLYKELLSAKSKGPG